MDNPKQPNKAKTTTIGGTILAILLAVAYSFLNNGKTPNHTTPAPNQNAPVQTESRSKDAPSTPAPVTQRPGSSDLSSTINTRIGFASRRGMEEHFQKHGAEFGNIALDEYLLQAQALRDSPISGNILEAKRADGVMTRFDKKTGSFLAINPDKTIRTFFRPNDGERYFRRQAEREDDQQ